MLIRELLSELNVNTILDVGDRVRHSKLFNPQTNPRGTGVVKFKQGNKVYVLPDGKPTPTLSGGRIDIDRLWHFDQGQLISLNPTTLTRGQFKQTK